MRSLHLLAIIVAFLFIISFFITTDCEHFVSSDPNELSGDTDIYDRNVGIGSIPITGYRFVGSPYPQNSSWLSLQGLLPWWNSTRSTRNTSYDLRGDVPIFYNDVGPWHIAPNIPVL
jgi:hypothetical protein